MLHRKAVRSVNRGAMDIECCQSSWCCHNNCKCTVKLLAYIAVQRFDYLAFSCATLSTDNQSYWFVVLTYICVNFVYRTTFLN